jgi:hypothetical protein
MTCSCFENRQRETPTESSECGTKIGFPERKMEQVKKGGPWREGRTWRKLRRKTERDAVEGEGEVYLRHADWSVFPNQQR